ncbi:hypothetical protein ACHAW6_016115 [Cyclotella cf. meneghiniana]
MGLGIRVNNGNIEKDCRSVEFPSELDLGNCCNISDVASKYSIRGAIFHDGEEVNSGHYRAAIKNYDTDNWVLMDDHEVEKLDLSVPHEQASFANRMCQPQMLLYISSEFIDVYKEDDKRFRVTRRIPIASQNDSLHNLNEVDSLNGKLAPKLNSPSEHFDTVDNSIPVYVAKGDESIRPMSNKACSSVEIARGYTSGFLSDDVSMEHHLSSPEHKNQSHYHEMTPTSIDNSGAEFDFNISDTGLENAESPPSEHFDIVDNSIPVSVAKGDESICPMSNKDCSRQGIHI